MLRQPLFAWDTDELMFVVGLRTLLHAVLTEVVIIARDASILNTPNRVCSTGVASMRVYDILHFSYMRVLRVQAKRHIEVLDGEVK